MTTEHFITRPMSLWLDLVRAIAALVVVVGHAHQLEIYTGYYPFSLGLQKNAVVVFFVLSGLVIATATDKREDSLSSYVIARISRIVPVAVVATLVALAVAALDANLGAAPMFEEDLGWADPVEALQALLFLSSSYDASFALNPVHWSLCYEVWFYALFAAATFARGGSRWLWLGVLGLAAGPNALLLLPSWLVGVWIARSPRARNVPAARASMYLALALVSLFIMPKVAPPVSNFVWGLVPWSPYYSLYAPTDFALALATALGFMGLRALSAGGFVLPAACEKPVRYLAGCSFSLYLLHWPLLKLARMAGIGANDSLVGFVAIVAGVVAVSAAFATVTEHRRYATRAMLERWVRPSHASPRASASAPALRPSSGESPRWRRSRPWSARP